MKEDGIITVNLADVLSVDCSFNLHYSTFYPISLHTSHTHFLHEAGKHESILEQCIQQRGGYWSKSVLVDPVKFEPK